MRGVLQVESSTTAPILRTGGSTNLRQLNKEMYLYWFVYLAPKLLMIKVVTVWGTRSGRRDRTTNILCNSLQEFSHSPERERERER